MTYWNPVRRRCPEKSTCCAKIRFPAAIFLFNISVPLRLLYGTDDEETTTWRQIHLSIANYAWVWLEADRGRSSAGSTPRPPFWITGPFWWPALYPPIPPR